MRSFAPDFLIIKSTQEQNIVGKTILITSITNSTSSSTGSLIVKGGMGIGGDIYQNGTINSSRGNFWPAGGYGIAIGQAVNNSGAGMMWATNGRIQVPMYLQYDAPWSTNVVVVQGGVNATSTSTGALQVLGGTAIGKDLIVGGNVTGKTLWATAVYTNNINNSTNGLPTAVNNLSSVINIGNVIYTRVGNVLTGSFLFNFVPSASGTMCTASFTLPVPTSTKLDIVTRTVGTGLVTDGYTFINNIYAWAQSNDSKCTVNWIQPNTSSGTVNINLNYLVD